MVSSPCPESHPACRSNSFVSSFNLEPSTFKCPLLSRCFRIIPNSCLPKTRRMVHFFALFCILQKPIPRLFKQFHALAAKHPGWHSPKPLPFAARNMTAKQQAVTPFRATLASPLQPIENPATLSRVVATLTHFVTPNPCVCHSYKKTPGWRATCRARRRPPLPNLMRQTAAGPDSSQLATRPEATRDDHGNTVTAHGFRSSTSFTASVCRVVGQFEN
jgi:hypothetical protein